jgi:signal transduction histidine kinase
MNTVPAQQRRTGGWASLLLFSVLYTLIYLLVEHAGHFATLQNHISLWYPAAALMMMVVLRLRLIGAVIATFASLIGFGLSNDNQFSVAGAILYSIFIPVGVLLIRSVLRRLGYLDPRTTPRPKFAIALISASAVFAVWATLLLIVVGYISPGGQAFSLNDALRWFMGYWVGATALGGFAFQLLFPLMLGDMSINWPGLCRGAKNLLLIGSLSLAPFVLGKLHMAGVGFQMAFLSAIPVFYAALSKGYAVTSLAIVCANISFMLTAHDAAATHALELQALALMINIGGMLTAAITTNQAAMLRALRQTLAERDQLTSERLQFEKKLAEAQRLDSLGRMAGGLAHEINNLLHPIKSFARSAATATDEKRAHYLSRINDCTDSAHRIVSDVLIFARDSNTKSQSKTTVFFAQQAVETSLAIAADGLPKAIQLNSDLHLEAAQIRCDSGGVSQVLVNLINNARDAMPNGGSISVVGDIVELDAQTAARTQLPANCYMRLRISDTGEGMSTIIAQRIFEPFFTTKDVGQGTGLGLSVVYGLVKRWGGNIIVSSAEGVGTTFTVLIPLASATQIDHAENET